MRDKETGLAGGSLQARSDDQLSGLISSSNNLSANANQAQLISSIKAHIARGDKAAKKAEDHYIAAGQYLAALKKEHAGSWAEWAELLKTKVCISTGRASELMQIADGRKTVEGLAAASTERSKKHRALSSLRNEENADGRKSVEEMLADAAQRIRELLVNMAAYEDELRKELSSLCSEENAGDPEASAEITAARTLLKFLQCPADDRWSLRSKLLDALERGLCLDDDDDEVQPCATL